MQVPYWSLKKALLENSSPTDGSSKVHLKLLPSDFLTSLTNVYEVLIMLPLNYTYLLQVIINLTFSEPLSQLFRVATIQIKTRPFETYSFTLSCFISRHY